MIINNTDILKHLFSDIGLINVYIEHDGEVDEVSLIDGDRGNVWRTERIPITSMSKYKVSVGKQTMA